MGQGNRMKSGWFGSHRGAAPQKTSDAYHVGTSPNDFPVFRPGQTVVA